MDKKELLELVRKATALWWQSAYPPCLFCRQRAEETSCRGCPIKARFGECGKSKRNPYSTWHRREQQRLAIVAAGERWIKQLERERDE